MMFKNLLITTSLVVALGSSATKASVESAMSGHILSQASLMGKYAKN